MKENIRNIYCIGRNYADHAKEMGASPGAEPVVFFKPSSSILVEPEAVSLPDFSANVHHEVELICQIAKDAYKVGKMDAEEYIYGYGIGIDFTARDLQKSAKDEGKPWALAKGFYGSGPISKIVPKENFDSDVFVLELKVNSETKQKGSSKDMIWQIPELIEYLSHRFKLLEGDLIFTGTPEGVGKVESEDKLELYLNGERSMEFKVL